LASARRSQRVRGILRQGKRYDFGAWRLCLVLDPRKPGLVWDVTCRGAVGNSVERHRHERMAKEALRRLQLPAHSSIGLEIVVQWLQRAKAESVKSDLRELVAFVAKRLGD